MSRVFDLVLGVFREPGLVSDLRDKELPENLSLVIRLAAGEGAALQCALDTTGETPETLVDACVFFLQQVLFAPGADSYRVLGADNHAPQERLRDNYRWLMKWLHPDHNQDGWEAVYADRVNVAWQDLKTPDRRAEHDRRSPSSQMLAPMTVAPIQRVVPATLSKGGPLLSGSTVRRLPALVLGTLGVAAAAMIGITYWAQSVTQQELSELRRNRDAPTEALAVRPDPVSLETPDPATATVAASAAVAALRADFEAIDGAYGDIALPTSVPPAAASEMAASVDAAALALTAEVPEHDTGAAAEPAPIVSAEKPADLSIPAPPVAAAPTAPIVAVPEKALEVPSASMASAQVVPELAPRAVATTKPSASVPVSPAPRPAPVAHAPAMPLAEPKEPAVASRPPDPLPVPAPLLTATESARSPPPARSLSTEAARVEPTPAPAATVAATEAAARAPVAVAAAPQPRPAPAQHDAEALVQEFAAAYAAGDLARFDRLFTRTSPDVAALIQMRSRFGETEMRYLEIQQVGWQAEAEQGRVRASYRDTYVPRGRRKAVIESGVIEWTIRVDSGDARIVSVARNNGGS